MTPTAPDTSPRAGIGLGLVTAQFHATWDFYTTVLGFSTEAENDGYVRLLHPGGATIEVLEEERNESWPELVSAHRGHGCWITLPVDHLAEAWDQALAAGATPLINPDQAHRVQAGFTVSDPNGVRIFVVPAVRPSRSTAVRRHSPQSHLAAEVHAA